MSNIKREFQKDLFYVLTFDDPKIPTVWYYGDFIGMIYFVQFVIDGCDKPEVYYLSKGGIEFFNLLVFARKYGIRKRTFTERMKDVKPWQYSEELKKYVRNS